MKRIGIADVAALAMALCAAGLTARTAYSVYERPRPVPTKPWNTVAAWRTYAAVGHSLGNAAARTTIVVFSDYECPVCQKLNEQLQRVLRDQPNAVHVVFRNFPLQFHPHARPAAMAAECAARQGRFIEYHNLLFRDQHELGQRSLAALAFRAGVRDTATFDSCLRDGNTASVVAADVAAGKRLGVFGTPTVLVNRAEYVGIPWDLRQIVERHIEDAQ